MKLTYKQRNGIDRKRFCHKSTNSSATERRRNTLDRLTAQLQEGRKPPKTAEEKSLAVEMIWEKVSLNKHDIVRIENEIKTLQKRI